MKSMTWPRRNPGSRRRRSMRLPTAPPRTSPRATAQERDARFRETRMMIATTKDAMSAKIHVCPVAKEKAAPGLRTRTSPRARPSSAVCRPSDSAESAHCLVTWSTTMTMSATSHRTITGRRLDRFPSAAGDVRASSMALRGLSVGGGTTLSESTALPTLSAASSTREAGSTWSGMGAFSHCTRRGMCDEWAIHPAKGGDPCGSPPFVGGRVTGDWRSGTILIGWGPS